MPYFSNYAKKDDEDQGAQGQGQENSQGGYLRGADGQVQAPSGAGLQAGAAPDASSKNAGNTGSQYQSLDGYLSGNADKKFGDQVTGKVQSAQNEGAAGQTRASEQFGNQVYSSNQVPTGEQIQGAVANPSSTDPKTYQSWMNQTYSGPKSLTDSQSLYNQYWDKTKKATDQTGMLSGNDSGQYSLLDSYFGGASHPGYSGNKAEQALDLSLAQDTAGYGNNVQNLQNSAAQLQLQGNQGANALQNVASQQAGNVENSANQARSAVGVDASGKILTGPGAGAIGNLEDTINQGVTDANTKGAASTAAIQHQLSEGDISGLTPEQLALFGLTPGQQTYGTNLGQYVQQGPAFTAANTMTPDQLAQLKALQSLAGISPDALGSTTLTGAGTPYNVDKAGATGAVGTAKAAADKKAYDTAVNNTAITIPPIEYRPGGIFGIGAQQSQETKTTIGEVLKAIQDVQAGKEVGPKFGFLNISSPLEITNYANKVHKLVVDKALSPLKTKYNQT